MKSRTALIGLIGLFIIFLRIESAAEKNALICDRRREAKVGEDVTLGCHYTREHDVTDGTIEWKFNRDIVLRYKSRGVSLLDQAKKFSGRASLDSSSWNPSEGKLAVKISPFKETDAGEYTCTVREIGRQPINCSTTLGIQSGDTVTLQCSIKTGTDVNKDLAVECSYHAVTQTDVDVFVFLQGKVDVRSQDETFKEFTDCLFEELSSGNFSLLMTFDYSRSGRYNYTVDVKKNNCSTNLTGIELQCPPAVEAHPGDNVTLPCSTKSQMDGCKALTVDWLYYDAVNKTYVDVLFREGKVDFHSQDERFKGNTVLLHKELWNFSLQMTVDSSHSGTYYCTVYNGIEKSNCSTTLTVRAQDPEKRGMDPATIGGGIGIIGIIVIIGGIIFIYCKRDNPAEMQENQGMLLEPLEARENQAMLPEPPEGRGARENQNQD